MPSIKNSRAITNLDAIVDDCDLGTGAASAHLKIYAGTVPANVDVALTTQTLLAELVMSNPAFGGAVDSDPDADATANAISDDTAADATGTASFARIVDRDGTARLQLSVSATGGGGELQLNSTSIVANVVVGVTSLVLTHREA